MLKTTVSPLIAVENTIINGFLLYIFFTRDNKKKKKGKNAKIVKSSCVKRTDTLFRVETFPLSRPSFFTKN